MHITTEIQQLLKKVADHYDIEDRAVRERQIRTWRKLKLFWNNFTNVWWDEVAHDWRVFDSEVQTDSFEDQAYYDKSINIFRAYLESIIAALSVDVPSIICYPDDAQNPSDLSTAKAGDKIAQLVYRHNEVSLLWLHSLYIYMTEGMLACYGYPKESKEYGTYKEKKTKNEEIERYVCPSCGVELEDSLFAGGINGHEGIVEESLQLQSREKDEFMPDDDDVEIQNLINDEEENEILCPECSEVLDPALQKSNLIVTRFVGETELPKTRICLESYGGLNIKIPNYSRNQKELPYLRYSYEVHYSKVIEDYPELAKKGKDLTGMYDPYESWGRLNPQYNGEYPINVTTMNHYWFRPWSFNILSEEEAEKLKKLFPSGCHLTRANDCFADAENESLDDCWTILINPLSDYLHYDPLGLLLTSVQEITNEMISLMLQTVEHGIPQTFADPAVLNFKGYSQMESTPGSIYPARPKSGKSMGESFYEVKTATFSPEYPNFFQLIQSMGQLTSGALPSLFGGQLEGSKTASEYSMSRSQALQRQQNVWKTFLVWWKTIFGKVIPMYIKEVVEDEKEVERDDQGNFINVFIRKAELSGRIGKIEIEGSENLPMSWLQIKETITNLMQSQNPVLMEMMMSPENLPYIRESLGLVDMVIPGEDDRQKQLEEIRELVNSVPLEMPAEMNMEEGEEVPLTLEMTPEMIQVSSIEVDPDVDNHEIEAQVCRAWLISEAGRLAKIENPEEYMNVLLHFKAHIQLAQLQQQQQMMQQQAAASPKNAAAMPKKEQEDSSGNRLTVQ